MKWEYLVEGLPSHLGTNIGIVKATSPQNTVMNHLNQRGEEGWELVEFSRTNGSSPGCDIYAPGIVFLFKRPRA